MVRLLFTFYLNLSNLFLRADAAPLVTGVPGSIFQRCDSEATANAVFAAAQLAGEVQVVDASVRNLDNLICSVLFT